MQHISDYMILKLDHDQVRGKYNAEVNYLNFHLGGSRVS